MVAQWWPSGSSAVVVQWWFTGGSLILSNWQPDLKKHMQMYYHRKNKRHNTHKQHAACIMYMDNFNTKK